MAYDEIYDFNKPQNHRAYNETMGHVDRRFKAIESALETITNAINQTAKAAGQSAAFKFTMAGGLIEVKEENADGK